MTTTDPNRQPADRGTPDTGLLPDALADPAIDAERRDLVVTHTHADGTLLTGTRRDDDLYRLLRSLGWLYRRSVGDYRLQGSVDKPAKTGAINRTADALRHRGFTVHVQIDNTHRAADDAETDRADRAEERAGRLHQRAERLHSTAAAREAAGHAVLDHIPLGQPYLVDSSGYAADRRRRERAVTNLVRAAELRRAAGDTEQAADTAATHMSHRHSVETVANRIRDYEAERRDITRRRDRAAERDRLLAAGVPADRIPLRLQPLNPAQHQELTDRDAWLAEQLRYWTAVRDQQITDGQATHYTRDHIARGDLVRYRQRWYLVLRTNAKSVTVPAPLIATATDTITYERLTDHVQPTDERWTTAVHEAVATAYALAGATGPHTAVRALADRLSTPPD